MLGKIDDPVDASFEAWPENEQGFSEKFAETALSLGGSFWKPAAILDILKNQFLRSNRVERVKFLLNGFRLGLKNLESDAADDRERLSSIEARLNHSSFHEAVGQACEEAARASSERVVERMSAVLVGAASANDWSDASRDLAAQIRDLAQLGEDDIRALDLLRVIFKDVLRQSPNLNDPNSFTSLMPDYRTAIARVHIHPEEFNSNCVRLAGFGLAIEVLRSPSRMELHEYCYRPTRRGLFLLECLDRAGRVPS